MNYLQMEKEMNMGDTEQNIKTESSIWQEAEHEGKKIK